MAMSEHKFRVGQAVRFYPSGMAARSARGTYVVMAELPEREGEFQYRIKSIVERHERVARESELRRG
jgi:hypothetical protein